MCIYIRCIAFDQVNLLDLAGPAQVFATATQLAPGVEAIFEVCSLNGGTVMSDTHVGIETQKIKEASQKLDVVLVPGSDKIARHLEDQALVTIIRDQAEQSDITASVCTGSLLLARAGLLTGKRAATHWRFTSQLQQLDTRIRVDPDAIFVEDGAVWTSAGVSSGIDLALALVARLWGRPLALEVARELVVPMVRVGDQKQFSTVLNLQTDDAANSFEALNTWIYENAEGDCRVETLADRCGMSPRSFARHYRNQVGETPAKMVERIRVERARQLLESTSIDLGGIARSCGFASVNQLRLAFTRVCGVTPSHHRLQFGHTQTT